MSRATVEEFQQKAAELLAAVERGEHFVIARGNKAVARLLPVDEDQTSSEREDWLALGLEALERAYGPGDPEYTEASIIERNPHYRP